MSTATDIITRGLRMAGVTARGYVPAGLDAEDALQYLQSVVLGLPGFVHNGGTWREKAITSAADARESYRYTVTTPGAVTLPASITSCWSCGCSRAPYDLAKVQIFGEDAENPGIWLYSATKAAWGRADALEIGSELPFGAEDDEGLAALLAVNISDEYGAQIGERVAGLAARATRSFRSRFKAHEAPRCCFPRDYY